MPDILDGTNWHIHHGDTIPHLASLPPACFDFSIQSPPFPSMFSYTSLPEDIGNSEDLHHEAKLHLGYWYQQLARVVKPGRIVIVHVTQIPGMLRNGEKGIFDFRGLNIRIAKRAGFIYQHDWLITKNPQSQAIRTHSHKLLFVTLERDRAGTCGAMGDYLLKFIAPGDNAVPIDSPGITRDDWIRWAECAWTDIQESDTLNVREGRATDDVKHICPLQLEPIRRCTLLYTNPGEIVQSSFAGIGSEGFVALGGKSPKTGKRIDAPRRFYGTEIKDEYVKAAKLNFVRAEECTREMSRTLFDDEFATL